MLDACLGDGNGQTVLVRGEAGIGKTRLVEEFARIAETRGCAIHKGLVLDFGAGFAGGAIRSLVEGLLDCSAGDKAKRRLCLDRAISDGLVLAEQRIFLNDLLDIVFAVSNSETDSIESERRILRSS